VVKPERQRQEDRQLIRADDGWEPLGHTPLPEWADLRSWDHRLLQTWRPFYVPIADKCNLCCYGECNLSAGDKGNCGIDANTMQARLTLGSCCGGLASMCSRARRIIGFLIDEKGKGLKLGLGDKVAIEAPHIRAVLGLKPESLDDLVAALNYIENQLVKLLPSVNSGTELASIDFESKSLHASMLAHAAMEAAELAAISGFGFPTSQSETGLADAGPGAFKADRPVILLAGSDTLSALCLVLAGIGSVGHDLIRYSSKAVVAGTLSQLPSILKAGLADVVLCSGGSGLEDIAGQAKLAGMAFIATEPAAAYGLADVSAENTEVIAIDLQNGRQLFLPDPRKAAAVAAETAIKLYSESIKAQREKKLQAKAFMVSGKLRVGRGPVMDTEIRKVGAPLVLGTIPGVIAIVGGSNYPNGWEDVAEIAEEFARRKYIVVLAGDSAIAAAMKKDAEGRSIYERYQPDFEAGGIINIGSGIAAAHISGAAIKIASIFAALPLRANYEVVADYILNRVGVCGLAWGASGEEELALATGCNRLGVPVIVGPRCIKYGRLYLSRPDETAWAVMDGREKKPIDSGEPSPEHLINLVSEKGKAVVAMAKLCMRKNDTPQGRQTKLTHYVGLHKQHFGNLPEDVHLFIRRISDIPIFYKKELQSYLEVKGWREKPVLSLPTLIGTYPSQVELDEVVR
jgi:CO dehydrogenase/acetyl-CoA synthase alpha subunit